MRKGMQLISILLIIAILAIPAGAASFTPSVEQKGAPTLSELTDESGKSVAAIVTDAEGREVMSVSSDSVTVTSVADIQEAPEEVQAAKWADKEEIYSLIDSGAFISYYKSYIDMLFNYRTNRGNIVKE